MFDTSSIVFLRLGSVNFGSSHSRLILSTLRNPNTKLCSDVAPYRWSPGAPFLVCRLQWESRAVIRLSCWRLFYSLFVYETLQITCVSEAEAEEVALDLGRKWTVIRLGGCSNKTCRTIRVGKNNEHWNNSLSVRKLSMLLASHTNMCQAFRPKASWT